jgi:hypothetical protein
MHTNDPKMTKKKKLPYGVFAQFVTICGAFVAHFFSIFEHFGLCTEPPASRVHSRKTRLGTKKKKKKRNSPKIKYAFPLIC